MRIKRGDLIIENGKYYYELCKCGNTKYSYKTPFCRECYAEHYEYKRWRKNPQTIKEMEELLISFNKRVESQRYFVTMYDMFVDLITLYNFYCPDTKGIDSLPINKQISLMWKSVNKKYLQLDTDTDRLHES